MAIDQVVTPKRIEPVGRKEQRSGSAKQVLLKRPSFLELSPLTVAEHYLKGLTNPDL